MMKNMTLGQIAAACNGSYYGPEDKKNQQIENVVIDSRQAGTGSLFVALKGERADGHKFALEVQKNGACAALVEKLPEYSEDSIAEGGVTGGTDGDKKQPVLTEGEPVFILVKSTHQALKDLAAYYLSGLDIKVVGITGSVGKTSTKEMIASVLSQKYNVLKTEGNFNNEIGLPLTVFKIKEEHEVAVLEMGISEFGEMERLSAVARPDIGVITNIGVCHLENLKTRDGILKAKTEMFRYLKKDGVAVLNGDDDKLQTVVEVNGKTPVFFGIRGEGRLTDKRVSFYASDVEDLGLEGVKASIHLPQETFSVKIATPGQHNVYNALAAACVAVQLGLTVSEIKAGLEQAKTIKGRTNLIHLDELTVIDDCYNANPVSMKEALNILDTARGRKIAVLGDMGELGTDEKELHYGVGAHLAETGIDAVFTAGILSAQIVQALKDREDSREVFAFKEKEDLLKELLSYIKKGDTVLVKASHFMQFTEVVEALKNHVW